MSFLKSYTVLSFIIFLLFENAGLAQYKDIPQDYLNKDFHKERRNKLRQSLPPNSVAVFFANPTRNRANDVEYIYHQDPNFYYLSGYREPHAVLLIFSEDQYLPNGSKYNELIFIQPRNKEYEQWTGERLGVKRVKEQLGFEQVYPNTDFADLPVDFTKFDKILFEDFHDDVRKTQGYVGLYDLIQQFKEKTNYQKHLENHPESGTLSARNIDVYSLRPIIAKLRGIKTKEEINLLRKAVWVSAIGQIETMKAMHPKMSEAEIQGIHEFVFKKYGVEYEGYPSIIGAGYNGCILHYITNNKPQVKNELVLMDVGAEYRGYTADVTRTIPPNGKFSKEQRKIYQLVYEAQEAGIKACKSGNSFMDPYHETVKIIAKGLVDLGITQSEYEYVKYYPHRSSHHIGLDVHDAGETNILKPNMIITVEPGIYIPEGSPCDKKWWNIAVRIEDDILITENGYENLSELAPRKIEDIEKMMKQESALDDFILPEK